MTMSTAELGTKIDDMGTNFEEFKKKNDERIEAILKGVPSAELEVEVNKINATITKLQGEVDAEVNLRKATEKVQNRLGVASGREMERSKELVLAHADLISFMRSDRGQAVKNIAPDDLSAGDFEEIATYGKAIDQYIRRGPDGITNDVRNEIQVGQDPRGGYWVDPAISSRLIELIFETSPVRSVAFIETISTDSLEGDYDLDEAAVGGWVNEQSTRTGNTDTPDLGGWRIPVHEQFAEPRSTQQALDDARRDVAAWLIAKVGARFTRIENTAFVAGDGDSKPRGFTTYGSGVPSAATFNVVEQIVSGHATLLTTDGLINLIYSLKEGYRQGARFAMSNDSIASVRKLKDGDGNYIWQPDFTMQRADNLIGYPIVEMTDMPAIGAGAEAVAFANWSSAYTIVDRAGITVLRDPYTTKGKVKFYMTKRVGGDVVNFEAIKLQTIST